MISDGLLLAMKINVIKGHILFSFLSPAGYLCACMVGSILMGSTGLFIVTCEGADDTKTPA